MSGGNSDVVVCDNGTGFVKCGFAGENFPRDMFPSMVGRPTLRAEEDAIGNIEIKDIMCGDVVSCHDTWHDIMACVMTPPNMGIT